LRGKVNPAPRIETPSIQPHKKPIFYRYVIRVNRMKNIQKQAKENGVMCETPVYKPLHRHLNLHNCPNSDKTHDRALSIPLYPSLTKDEIEYLIEHLTPLLLGSN
jgi:dTDP-4-amino-4,6-dideoxygalactose transaminase